MIPGRAMTISQLRNSHPDWEWKAFKTGLGWSYTGSKPGQQIKVFARSVIVDAETDSFVTVWYVQDCNTGETETYTEWVFKILDNRLCYSHEDR